MRTQLSSLHTCPNPFPTRLSVPREAHDRWSPSHGPTVPASGTQAMALASWMSFGRAGPAKFMAVAKAERQVESHQAASH